MTDVDRLSKKKMAKQRSLILGLRYFDTSKLKVLPRFDNLLSVEDMNKDHVVILTHNDHSTVIGITTKTPQASLKRLNQKFPDDRVSFVLITEEGHKDFMNMYDPPEKIEYQDVAITSDSSSKTLQEVSETIEKILADDLFDYLLRQALRLQASDVHLETNRDEKVRIRFRVHGVLHDIAKLSMDKYRQLSSTVAVNADISTNAPKSQTGHITYNIDSNEVNIRIETAPTLYGQDTVLRVFAIEKKLLDLENLGFNEDQLKAIYDIIDDPSGLVLTVGPTGSGKTTTLYSIINQLNKPDVKIITLEDPVEYSLSGLVQIPIQTKKVESFADGLRAVMRMDPDVIMIGEIRDSDTANTALQAALSGHLVLSTFHASDTAAALARLLTFTKGNPMFTTALRLVIAQRLVRKLEDTTKQAYKAEQHIVENIRNILGDKTIDQDMAVQLFKAVPSKETPFGYSGRTAVAELMEMTQEIEKTIHRGSVDLVADEIRDIAHHHGWKSLLQVAIEKALAGETTIEEVYRVL
jgi:type II secretory ATPase GspE/PulE/Tfp pilus assembly ATPase PilB-like protein